MKKFVFSIAAVLFGLASFQLNAQTNIQLHYDFGRAIYHKVGGKDLSKTGANRQYLTTTVEHFNADKYGSNFFFIDLDFVNDPTGAGKWAGVRGAYTEISRELCFWGDTKLAGLSAHIEYNGGLDRYSGTYDSAYLVGPTYSIHNSDYTFTASLSALYKAIPKNVKNAHNFQITTVWNYHFCNDMFLFSGFADIWQENRPWQMGAKGDKDGDGTDFIFISEPQFWFNLHALKGLENFNASIGTEVELSNNFLGVGFYACPTIAVKYTF
ncbi:MAG: DUF5020 family protein [Bacteroidales bacterium]|nr:DUF5020 family protein [Bacteroidales bacterium]